MSNYKEKKTRTKTREEVISTINKYGLLNGVGIRHFGESRECEHFIWFLENGKIESYESPDAYIKIDNQVLIIEHFSIDGFDTYPNGGSKLQQYESKTDKEFRDIPVTKPFEFCITQPQIANSYEGFINNCRDKFEHHYKRISKYKEHLLTENIANENTKFTTRFLIDEVSPLGTLTYDGKNTHPVNLACSKEFLDYFCTKPDVDWIVSAIVRLPDPGFYPYFFSQKDIEFCNKKVLNYADFQFISMENMEDIRYRIIISKED